MAAKRNVDAILKEKSKELKSLSQRGLNSEKTIMDLERKLSQALVDVEREKEKRGSVEIKYNHLLDDLGERELFIERLSTDLFHANNVAASRETEFEELKKQNLEMQRLLQNQEQILIKNQEQMLMKNQEHMVEKDQERMSMKNEEHHHQKLTENKRKGESLNSVTEDFLDRVSAVSR